LNNTGVRRVSIGAEPQEVDFELVLAPGVNRIDMASDQPAVRSGARNQLRSFALHEAAVAVEALSDDGVPAVAALDN
jgi:hypothetical protein